MACILVEAGSARARDLRTSAAAVEQTSVSVGVGGGGYHRADGLSLKATVVLFESRTASILRGKLLIDSTKTFRDMSAIKTEEQRGRCVIDFYPLKYFSSKTQAKFV